MRLLIIFMLAAASLPAQNLKFKIKQLPKDTSVGRVVLSSLTDSTMTYSDLLKIDNDSLYFKGSGVLTSAMDVGGIVDLASQVIGTLPVANGGTGSDTLNFVDLTNAQTVGGAKTFTSALTQSGGDVNFDSGTLFVDEDANKVGIGTTSPGVGITPAIDYKLHIKGNGAGGVGRTALVIENTDTTSASSIRLLNGNGQSMAATVSGSGFTVGAGGFFAATNNLPMIFNTGGNVSSGDTASIIFRLGGFTADNDRVVFKPNGNVGIGTTNPSAKLDVEGDVTAALLTSENQVIANNTGTDPTNNTTLTNGTVYSLNGTSTNNNYGIGIGAPRNNKYDIWFQTGGVNGGGYRFYRGTSEIVTITNSGNVGIGTTSPQNKLDVEGGAVIGATYSGTNAAPTNGLLVEGNVGIGTDNPLQNLHISSSSAASILLKGANSNVASNIKLEHGGGGSRTGVDGTWNISFGSDETYFGTGLDMDGGLAFWHKSSTNVFTDVLRLKSNNNAIFSGNVGIGTTNPNSKLEVNGSATNTSANGESDATIDFSLSNIATTSSTNSTITLNNIKDGGAYTLITTATNTTSVVTFTASGFTIVYMGTVARTSGKQHLYSFIVAGTDVYVTMATEN